MSLESGGRADKYGNAYENRYLARLLLRLVQEKIVSIVVEPLGVEGVEFIALYSNGEKVYYQCKASNTTHSSWSLADLNRYQVFKRSKDIIERANANRYMFISPLQYNELDELCRRARTNSFAQEFVDYQLSNSTLRGVFDGCANYYDLNKDDPTELKQLVDLLARCYFEQSPTGIEAEQDLNEHVGMLFTGKADAARVLLEEYANQTGRYGVAITAKDVVDYLEERDIYVRSYFQDARVLSRVSTLNEIYWGTYRPIQNDLMHRAATDSAIQKLQDGHSIILHGRAGAGKSGCVQELIQYLNQAHILHLAIKLDKQIPDISADVYGKNLGLPQSPVYCLHTLSGGKPCVLVLDQLDSLRWTSMHSAKALDVCKEMILQAAAINQYENGKISIVFVSRTFDLENDRGLKALFDFDRPNPVLIWDKIYVDLFAEEEVAQVVGTSYQAFSPRLKKLLQTPSSLFVWTQLEEQAKTNAIVSIYQLMDAWWSQVQARCEDAGVTNDEVKRCKDILALQMDTNSVLALPMQLFADHQKVIDLFVSNGLLVKSESRLSFTHQSFLDYFIAAGNLLELYSGKYLADLLGSEEKQTPNLRYRLLIILQNLLDSDRDILMKQCESVLTSETVRFYFKCAVFEVIGQCEDPNQAIYNLIQQYSEQSEWKNYILQSVYLGHPAFVMHLNQTPGFNWLDDQNLGLLRSINRKEPDFVVDLLRPYAFQTTEQDQKIFWALCHDATDDSDSMFTLRTELLAISPELLNHFWSITELMEHRPDRAIKILNLIIEKSTAHSLKEIYLGQDNAINDFAQSNYLEIVGELYPRVFAATHTFVPTRSRLKWSDDYKRWVSSEHNGSIVRKIVEIVKLSCEEYAQKNPVRAMQWIKGIAYPTSIVCHEIITHMLRSLSIEYCDDVVQWLLTDFENKVFVYTEDEADYLFATKQLIAKFSSNCSAELFGDLEQKICAWQDDPEQMRNIYKHRIEVQSCQEQPVYYAYWGHFQKELLPVIEQTRLSKYAQELIGVLKRNPWIEKSFYNCGFLGGMMGAVSFPIGGYAEKISDACWLKIISTPNDQMQNRWRSNRKEGHHVEATHRAFASSLARQAKLQPSRFARLSLMFPENCAPDYIYSVLSALRDCDGKSEPIDVSLIIDVIRRYGHHGERNVAAEIADLIEKFSAEEWPADIIDCLEDLALHHPDPETDEYVVISSADPDHHSCDTLHTNAINCVRGGALYAVSSLLWQHRSLHDRFKSTVLAASEDVNPAVRFAAAYSVLPFYNIDPTFAVLLLKKLIAADLRILAAPDIWQIISREYDGEPDYYRGIFSEACRSEVEDLAKCAAGMLCAVAIFSNDQQAVSLLTNGEYSTEQENEICRQAISSFDQDQYHERSKMILCHFIQTGQSELQAFTRLFYKHCLMIQRDEAFLVCLMQSKQGVYLIDSFIQYLSESSEDIGKYAVVLKTIVENAASARDEYNIRWHIKDLIQCVIRLFDRGKDDRKIRKICLDIWDDLYRSNIQDVEPLSNMIDELE